MKFSFKKDVDRDATIMLAQLSGKTLSQLFPMLMGMPEFNGGPDAVIAYAKWMSRPNMKPYRQKVADRVKAVIEEEKQKLIKPGA